MPTVTAFIDDLRLTFGKAEIDQAIRRGLKDGSFHAAEAGYEVGVPVVTDETCTVRLNQMVPWSERQS